MITLIIGFVAVIAIVAVAVAVLAALSLSPVLLIPVLLIALDVFVIKGIFRKIFHKE